MNQNERLLQEENQAVKPTSELSRTKYVWLRNFIARKPIGSIPKLVNN